MVRQFIKPLLILAFLLTSGCQSFVQQPSSYSSVCGHVLVETEDSGTYRCALGHSESIYVVEGFEVEHKCRALVTTGRPSNSSRSSYSSRSSSSRPNQSVSILSRPPDKTKYTSIADSDYKRVGVVDSSKTIYMRPCNLPLWDKKQEGVYSCSRGHSEEIAVQGTSQDVFYCREVIATNEAPPPTPSYRPSKDAGPQWGSILAGATVIGLAALVLNDDFRSYSGDNYATATDNETRQLMISASIASYPGNCPCPYSTDSVGRRCGERSAYSKPGGHSPLCYESDISYSDLMKFKEIIKK